MCVLLLLWDLVDVGFRFPLFFFRGGPCFRLGIEWVPLVRVIYDFVGGCLVFLTYFWGKGLQGVPGFCLDTTG